MRLPPLNALRAFEATARLGSVKGAAAELHVTPAAVSQQLRVLEAYVGQPLFERRPRALRLTVPGQTYQQSVSRHLRAIAEATAHVASRAEAVAISVVPSFATLWLAPRVAAFARDHPRVEIRAEADPTLVDFRNTTFDLAIREGWGQYRDAQAALLIPIDWMPVAAPAYRASLASADAVDWMRARLLHEGDNDAWDDWLRARGIEVDPRRAAYFSHGMMAYAAAEAGEGIALAPRCLVERALREERLVAVDPFVLRSSASYWLAWARSTSRPLGESARLFRDWLIDESATYRRDLPTEPTIVPS